MLNPGQKSCYYHNLRLHRQEAEVLLMFGDASGTLCWSSVNRSRPFLERQGHARLGLFMLHQ